MTDRDQDDLVQGLTDDPARLELEPMDRALVDYAVKLTESPQAMTADDVASLRAAGCDDRAIHDVCAIAAYFNFVNRMADGLGVELE